MIKYGSKYHWIVYHKNPSAKVDIIVESIDAFQSNNITQLTIESFDYTIDQDNFFIL